MNPTSIKVPRMTRGHYQFIADTLGEIAESYGIPKEALANSFANRLVMTNPRFKRDRFVNRVTNFNKVKHKFA